MPNRPVRFSCARTAHSRRPANARQKSMFVVLPDTQDRHLIFLLAGPSSGTLLLGVHSGSQKTLWLRSFPGFAVLLLSLLCVVCACCVGPTRAGAGPGLTRCVSWPSRATRRLWAWGSIRILETDGKSFSETQAQYIYGWVCVWRGALVDQESTLAWGEGTSAIYTFRAPYLTRNFSGL